MKTHWSSCSVNLPDPLSSLKLMKIIEALPKSIIRIKGCTRLDEDSTYSFFEKTPALPETKVRPHHVFLSSGPKILVIGPGSDPTLIENIIEKELNS